MVSLDLARWPSGRVVAQAIGRWVLAAELRVRFRTTGNQ